MKKRILSTLLTLCIVLALLPATALAALTPTSIDDDPTVSADAALPMTSEEGVAPISVEIGEGNCTFIEQEDTLYTSISWNDLLVKDQISGFYSVKSGSEITVSHTGDDSASIIYIVLEQFTKSAESNIVEYYENEDFELEDKQTADFKDKYFRYDMYTTVLSDEPGKFDERLGIESVPDGCGHYWIYGPFGFYLDDDAREVKFSSEDNAAILLSPGDSVTLTIPNADPDAMYQLCATIIYPELSTYFEGKYAIKFDGEPADSTPAEPEQPSEPAEPTQPAAPGVQATDAVLSPQKLTVDGKNIDCEKYNIGGSNYFKLRDLAYLLNNTGSQFGVGFDEATSTVSITTKMAYMPAGTELVIGADNSATAQTSAQSILIDGEAHGELTVYNIGGSNFFQLRELGTLLNFEVDYDADTNTAIVRSVQN